MPLLVLGLPCTCLTSIIEFSDGMLGTIRSMFEQTVSIKPCIETQAC
jgi:hypothetical protein